jgi:RNA polymerase sigma factor (sigma-70 family)
MISSEELEAEIEALVAEHCQDLARYLQYGRLRLPEHLVGEVINDALLVVVDKRRRGHTIGNVRSYLFTVARNAAIDCLKTRYAAETLGLETIAGYQAEHDMLTSVETRQDLRNAMRLLPRRQQQVLELRRLGFTVGETAEILGIAEGTVGATTTAARRRLEQIMNGQAEIGGEETA